MEDCPDPLAVVSPESSNHRMIGSVTPRIIKIIGAPDQAKNNEKKDEVVSTRPCRLKVIQNKGCQRVKVSPGSSPTLSKVLLSKEALDTRLIYPSSVKPLDNQTPVNIKPREESPPVASASLWQKQVYIRTIKKCDREPLSITDWKKKLQTEVHLSQPLSITDQKKTLQKGELLSPKSGVPRNPSLKRLVKCNYCDYQTESPTMMRSHLKIDHRKLHKDHGKLHRMGLGYTVKYVERNNKNEHNENLNYVPIKPKKKLTSVTDHFSNMTRIHCCKLCDFATKYLQSIQGHFKRKHKPIESRSEGDLYEYIEYERDNEQSIVMLPPGDPGFKIINEHGEILKRNLKCKYCNHKAERINLMRSHLEENHWELHEYEGGLGYTVSYVERGKRCEKPPVEFVDENKEMALMEDQALSNNIEEENQRSCENDLTIKSEIIIKEEPIDVDDFKSIAKEEPREFKSTSEDKEYLLEAELMEEEPDPLAWHGSVPS